MGDDAATADRYDALRVRVSDRLARSWLVAALAPVVVFLASVPVAVVDADRAPLAWVLIWPIEQVLGRLRPVDEPPLT